MVRSSVEALMVYPGSKVDGTVGAVRDSLGWLRRTYHVLEVRKVDPSDAGGGPLLSRTFAIYESLLPIGSASSSLDTRGQDFEWG